MRIKKMPLEEFQKVMKCEWSPVEIPENALPSWTKNIPGNIRYLIAGSGSEFGGIPYKSPAIQSGDLIGGIDVWRKAPDDPVELNKDWYAVVKVDDEPMLLVEGPFKDGEHWSNELPDRLKNIEILGVPKKIDV